MAKNEKNGNKTVTKLSKSALAAYKAGGNGPCGSSALGGPLRGGGGGYELVSWNPVTKMNNLVGTWTQDAAGNWHATCNNFGGGLPIRPPGTGLPASPSLPGLSPVGGGGGGGSLGGGGKPIL